jgi:hypothetical protein
MANSKTYKKPRGPRSNDPKSHVVQHVVDFVSEQSPLQWCVNHAIVELELRSHSCQATPKEHTGPPCGAKCLDGLTTQQGMKGQASHHPSSPVPISLSSHASSPPPPTFHHALMQASQSPSRILATSSSPAHFPMVNNRALEDEINAPKGMNNHPLFLSDDGYGSDSDGPVADQEDTDDFIDAPVADQEDGHDLDDDDNDLDEEVVSSMMTGGHFTQEQVLEVKGLANNLIVGLMHCAKAWGPLDAVMWIENLVIATEEQWAGGNVWNAYQNVFPEDPEKATHK